MNEKIEKPFTVKDIDRLKKALKKAGAKPTKFYRIRVRGDYAPTYWADRLRDDAIRRAFWKQSQLMNEKIEKLFKFIKELMDSKKSVQVRLNFHEGDMANKIEVKEGIDLK